MGADTLRILDANLNRAREALRVQEDAARFCLDDAPLAAELKALRHRITTDVAGRLPALGWTRDTAGDVGRTIDAPSEEHRPDLPAVAIAAGKRLGEALRSVEEYAKLHDGAAAATAKALRYRGYELEQTLLMRLGAHGARRQWRVCVLLTESLCRHPWTDVARAVFAAGADAVQLREKALPDAELLRRARWLVEEAPRGVAVVVNDRTDVALAAGADGVHLGTGDLPIESARRVAGARLLIGASTHDAAEAAAAVAAGADYCGVGAVFSTPLKPERDAAGPELVRSFVARYPSVPHLAIGGITPSNVQDVVAAGGQGVAVSGAVCGAEDPGAVVAALRACLGESDPVAPAAGVVG